MNIEKYFTKFGKIYGAAYNHKNKIYVLYKFDSIKQAMFFKYCETDDCLKRVIGSKYKVQKLTGKHFPY